MRSTPTKLIRCRTDRKTRSDEINAGGEKHTPLVSEILRWAAASASTCIFVSSIERKLTSARSPQEMKEYQLKRSYSMSANMPSSRPAVRSGDKTITGKSPSSGRGEDMLLDSPSPATSVAGAFSGL